MTEYIVIVDLRRYGGQLTILTNGLGNALTFNSHERAKESFEGRLIEESCTIVKI